MKVIGLTGMKESGKTTTFNLIKELSSLNSGFSISMKYLLNTCLTALVITLLVEFGSKEGIVLHQVLIKFVLLLILVTPVTFIYDYLFPKKDATFLFKKKQKIIEIQLAKKLKDVCSKVYCIPRTYFDDQKFKEVPFMEPVIITSANIKEVLSLFNVIYTPTVHDKHIGKSLKSPREVAQYIGTEVLRELDPDIHCREAIREALKENADIGIVTDMRFPNEFSFFEKEKSFVGGFFVYRSQAYNSLVDKMKQEKVHDSETGILYIIPKMTVINNCGNLESLEDEIERKVLPLIEGK